jgi:hypothetical protein
VSEEYVDYAVGCDALDPGLKLERIRLKARRLEGLPDETVDDVLKKAAEDADKG